MYEQFYRLSEKPFGLTSDPRFVYPSVSHEQALRALRDALPHRECFAVVEGDVGTGKTTLCRALVEEADRKTLVALVRHPPATPEDLLIDVLREFGVASLHAAAAPAPADMVDALHHFLASLAPLEATALVVVDEAQSLPVPVLDQLRVLTNLAAQKATLLQLVLVGQPSLRAVLRAPELRKLDLRLSLRVQLTPLSAEETAAYVMHRVAAAGGAGTVTFTPAALQAVHRQTHGIPRLVNMLCHRALLAGQMANAHTIGPELVTTAASGIELSGGRPAGRRVPWWRRIGRA